MTELSTMLTSAFITFVIVIGILMIIYRVISNYAEKAVNACVVRPMKNCANDIVDLLNKEKKILVNKGGQLLQNLIN
jgi:hypothetical protein